MKQSDDKNRMNDALWKYNTKYVVWWKKGERNNAEKPQRCSPPHQECYRRLAAGRTISAGRWLDIHKHERKYLTAVI